VASLLATGFMRRVPTVVSLDATPLNFDSQAQAYGHRTHPTAVEHFKTAFTGRAFNAAAALVTWCRWAAESLGRDYGVPAEKVTVIHPGVDLDLFAVPDRSARRGPVRLLFVGGDFERKGGVELLQAVSSLETDAELDVVCSKSSAPRRLPGGIPCRMHFGLAPQSEELLRLYREADVFVLPARGDCFPQAVAEALASGLPVVSTLVGAIPEMIRDGHNGLLVPARAPAPLSDALSALISDRALRLEMGERARRLAEREHDAGRNAQQILALMTSLSNQARLPRSA
jgi:glycosyltransferase involved in cell wall biosynthesis